MGSIRGLYGFNKVLQGTFGRRWDLEFLCVDLKVFVC